MVRFKAKIKGTERLQKVVFLDWDTTFVKLADGTLTDFKHCILFQAQKDTNGKTVWIQV